VVNSLLLYNLFLSFVYKCIYITFEESQLKLKLLNLTIVKFNNSIDLNRNSTEFLKSSHTSEKDVRFFLKEFNS